MVPVADEIIASLRTLSSDETYPSQRQAFDDLSEFLEHREFWGLLVDHLPVKTDNNRIALLRARALIHIGQKAAAESILRELWVEPVDSAYRVGG